MLNGAYLYIHAVGDSATIEVEMLQPSHDFSVFDTPFPWWAKCKLANPGWLYVITNGPLIKIGKTTNPMRRLKEARTWLPRGNIVGIKPFWNIHHLERTILAGIALICPL
jgi:hypothetical protein